MAIFKKIKQAAAPKPKTTPNRIQRRKNEYQEYVMSLATAEVGMLEPEAGETTRALSARVSRAGVRLGRQVDTWSSDGAVYFTVREPAASKAAKLEIGKATHKVVRS